MLKENQLFAKYRKFTFWLRSVEFHGNIISGEGLDVDQKKIEAVKNSPRPMTPTDIRSALGLVGYYRRFLDGFAAIESSLTTLTQKSKIFY